ncbi:MAG TPA: RNA 2',3'-cyclic phosphodiesterase [Candidatus Binatia bacterium]|nr:RNA 2',3'-cyclic phosphodiesterase [Candidatus Binatia bacterium]
MRCFVAVDVSPDVRAALGAAQAELRAAARRADVRWAEPAQFHVTLQFLGAVSDERVPEVVAALGEPARHAAPIALAADGLGAFPSVRRPRVVWAGMGGDVAALARLAGAVGRALAPLGFEPEARGFHAHLTLGRVRSPRGIGRLATALEAARDVALGTWTAPEVVLYQSRLRPTGAVYEAVARLPMGAGGAPRR